MIDTSLLVAERRAELFRPVDHRELERLALATLISGRIDDAGRRVVAIDRILRLGPEEVFYWTSWATRQDDTKNEWAQAGMAILFGGEDDEVDVDPDFARRERADYRRLSIKDDLRREADERRAEEDA